MSVAGNEFKQSFGQGQCATPRQTTEEHFHIKLKNAVIVYSPLWDLFSTVEDKINSKLLFSVQQKHTEINQCQAPKLTTWHEWMCSSGFDINDAKCHCRVCV